MEYRVHLNFFRLTGKFLTSAELIIDEVAIADIWEKVHELRRMGQLPGLRTNSGRDLFIVVDVPDHPQRVPHLVMPPFVNEDDVTPIRVPTGEVRPLVRLSLEEIPSARTTTRDIVKMDHPDGPPDHEDEETTPVDVQRLTLDSE